MDPIVGAVVIAGLKYVGQPSAEVLKDLVQRVLGPSADAKGQAIKEWLENRNNRAQQTVVEAATLLHDAAVEPQAVPGRLLLPILEWSSVQDEPELRLKWAALLANAATPDSNKTFPAFAEILRQLTPVHVRILDWMYAMRSYPVQNSIPYHPDVKRKTIEETFTLQPADYALLVTDMERLQLIEPRRDIPNMDDGEVDGDYLLRLIVARWNSRIKYNSINFTALGLRFMEACQPPTRVDKSA